MNSPACAFCDHPVTTNPRRPVIATIHIKELGKSQLVVWLCPECSAKCEAAKKAGARCLAAHPSRQVG